MEGLKDIKDIVEIHEYSFWLFLSLILAGLLLSLALYYLYKNKRKRKKRINKRELALTRLKEINFDDTKSAVYTFTVDGNLFVDENNLDKFKKIEQCLERYKYQKDTPKIEETEIEMMKEFIKALK